MLLDIIAVVPRPGFQLDLEFENGERRRFDMRPLLAMKPWNRIASPAVFERVRVDYGTVVWPGDIDVAPETLYDDSVSLVSSGLNQPSVFIDANSGSGWQPE